MELIVPTLKYLPVSTFSTLFVELDALFYLYKLISLGRVGWWGMAWSTACETHLLALCACTALAGNTFVCRFAQSLPWVNSCIMFCFNQCEWINTLGNLTRESGFERWATHEQKNLKSQREEDACTETAKQWYFAANMYYTSRTNI